MSSRWSAGAAAAALLHALGDQDRLPQPHGVGMAELVDAIGTSSACPTSARDLRNQLYGGSVSQVRSPQDRPAARMALSPVVLQESERHRSSHPVAPVTVPGCVRRLTVSSSLV